MERTVLRKGTNRITERLMGSRKVIEKLPLIFSRSQFVILKRGYNLKYLPYAFTQQGVAMLSSILRSKRVVRVNIEIVRAFVQLRKILASHAELARKLEALEKKYDSQFKIVFEAIRQLMGPKEVSNKRIRFQLKEKRAAYWARG